MGKKKKTKAEKIAKFRQRDNLIRGGDCSTCGRHYQMLNQKINICNVRGLTLMYKASKGTRSYVCVVPFPKNSSPTSAKYWKLIKPDNRIHKFGRGQQGYWRLTKRGIAFVEGKLKIHRVAEVWADEVYHFKGSMVDIRFCSGENFDYNGFLRELKELKESGELNG